MKIYCLKCKITKENKKLRVANATKGRITLLSKCAVQDSQKSIFIKNKKQVGY